MTRFDDTMSENAIPCTERERVAHQMVATQTTEGWTVTFPDRDPIPARVTIVEGDSIVVDVGPYEGALRKGVMVSTRSVVRLQDDNLWGLSWHGTRQPSPIPYDAADS